MWINFWQFPGLESVLYVDLLQKWAILGVLTVPNNCRNWLDYPLWNRVPASTKGKRTSATEVGNGSDMCYTKRALSVVARVPEFRAVHDYYTHRRKNPLKKMQSLIAISCKLIRLFYAILIKGIDYDGTKMLSDIRRPGGQIQAA